MHTKGASRSWGAFLRIKDLGLFLCIGDKALKNCKNAVFTSLIRLISKIPAKMQEFPD